MAIKSLSQSEHLTQGEAAGDDIQITVDSHADDSEPPTMQEEYQRESFSLACGQKAEKAENVEKGEETVDGPFYDHYLHYLITAIHLSKRANFWKVAVTTANWFY